MTASASPLFRGSRAVADVIDRMTPLADWLAAFRSDCKVITLARRDLEVLHRYPEAAQALHGITTSDGVTYWRGFELRAEAPSPPIRKQITPR